MTDAQVSPSNWSYLLSASTFLLLALLTFPALADGVHIVGIPGITDGDTIRVNGTKVRLFGIDAPERHQQCSSAEGQAYACGQTATRALADFIAGRKVDCVADEKDRYGRLVAVCTVAGEDVGGWMVLNGWAVAYRKYSLAYVGEEDRARVAKRGLWAGEFDNPWLWRKTSR